jgi:hypothetical protein
VKALVQDPAVQNAVKNAVNNPEVQNAVKQQLNAENLDLATTAISE